MLNKNITQTSYQITAHEYAHRVADLAPLQSINRLANLVQHKGKIIDLGCGSGRDAKLFTDRGVGVLGIDYCSNFIDIAAKHAPLAKFELQDIETMTLPAHSFDGAWAACTLAHFPKKVLPSILDKIHYLLKDNGHFYLSLKKGASEGLEKDNRYAGDVFKYWAYYEEDELGNILQKAKFKILELSLIKKDKPYHTHDAYRIFCQKA